LSRDEVGVVQERWPWSFLSISYLELAVLLGDEQVPGWFGASARRLYRGQIRSDSVTEQQLHLPIRGLIFLLVRNRARSKIQTAIGRGKAT
jgi:hypothetical protein